MHSGIDDKWKTTIPKGNWTTVPYPKTKKITDEKYKESKYYNNEAFEFRNTIFSNYSREVKSQGFIEEYWSEQQCVSGLVTIPGV